MAKSSKPVAMMQKNLTKEERAARLEAEAKVKGNTDLLYEEPTDITEEEKQVYFFLLKELEELGVLSNLDIELLKLTANTIINLRNAKECIRAYGQVLQKADGSLYKNPAVAILKDFEAIYARCCRELCLSPQSRMSLSRLIAETKDSSEDELLKILSE